MNSIPWNGGLEGFAHDVELVEEVADVGDAEGQHVTTLAVVRPTAHAVIGLDEREDDLLLVSDLTLCALHDDGARRHLQWIEALERQQNEFLHFRHDTLDSGWRWLEGLAEAKLGIVHQPDACRQSPLLPQPFEKANAIVESWKHERAVLLGRR